MKLKNSKKLEVVSQRQRELERFEKEKFNYLTKKNNHRD